MTDAKQALEVVERLREGAPISAYADVQTRLKSAIERERQAYLWSPSDTITFTPRVLSRTFGDGAALFGISTINQRPAYWVVRGCSTWSCNDFAEGGPEFAEFTDEILTELEAEFGNGRCAYSGISLFYPREERIQDCQCEECDDDFVAEWPMVDGAGGCSWWRIDWPAGFEVEQHPLARRGNVLITRQALTTHPAQPEGEGHE